MHKSLYIYRHSLVVILAFMVIAGCSTGSSLVDSRTKSSLPKASDDANIVMQLTSNVPRTTFYVDGKEVVTAERAKILINGRPHTITASPEGYISKEEYIQPPYDRANFLRFTFMIGEKIVAQNENGGDENKSEKVIGTDPGTPVDIEFNIPETKRVNENAIAVVIGNRDYSGDIPNVDYAINDAALVKEYLTKTFGFKPGNIIYEENAGKATFDAIFGNENDHKGMLYNYVRPGESDVFIYYSGHGAPDVNSKSAYLMPVDSNPSFVSFSGYNTNTLYENLARLNARSIAVFLDACFSGAAGNGKMLISNASPIGIQVKNPAVSINNSLIVSASSGDQISSWYPEMRHGLFTYFLLKAIKGEADINNNGTLTLDELKLYLTDQNNGIPYFARRLHNRIQTPTFLSNGYKEEIVRYQK